MHRPGRWVARSFLIVAATAVVYVAGAAIIGWGHLRENLRNFPIGLLVPLAGLSLVNYGLRWLRWEWYLRRLDARVPLRCSLILYFSAFLMVITPGKIGEVFKAALLRERFGIPLSRGVPIVLSERIYDFLGVLLMAAAGLATWTGSLAGIGGGLAAAAGVPILLALFHLRPVRERLLARLAARPSLARYREGLEGAATGLGTLLGPRDALGSVVLSTAAWACEGVGMWLVCRGLGLDVGVGPACFVYASATLLGSLSFLPGGLGGTEAAIVWLLGRLAVGSAPAGAAALIIRVVTLWLAVAIGLAFWGPSRRLLMETSPPAPGAPADS